MYHKPNIVGKTNETKNVQNYLSTVIVTNEKKDSTFAHLSPSEMMLTQVGIFSGSSDFTEYIQNNPEFSDVL